MSAQIESGTQIGFCRETQRVRRAAVFRRWTVQCAAATVARGLVEADLEGLPSHGVMLVDMYIEPAAERLRIQQTKRLPSYRNDKARSF